MSTPPGPSVRDQGTQALRAGDLAGAIDLLARAVMLNDHDAEAKAFLGVAYSQRGLHAQAKRALQSAVELQPRNANFHYNLGVALERAGDMQGAAVGFRDALLHNKDHAQARAKLQAMGPMAQQLLATAPKPVPPVGVPSYTQPPAQAPTFQPVAPIAPPSDAPPGTVQCPGCGQFSHLGLACEFCSSPLPPPVTTAPPPSRHGPPSGQGYVPMDPSALAHAAEVQSTSSNMGGFEAFFFRALAFIIDQLLLAPIFFAIVLLLGADMDQVLSGLGTAALSPRQLREAEPHVLASILQYVLPVIYETVMLATMGRTLGKMIFGLRVVDEMGDQIGWFRAFIRATIGRMAGSCACFLGYFWVIGQEDQRGWHDLLCGTHVVRR